MAAESAPATRPAPEGGRRAAALAVAVGVSAAGLFYAFHGIEWGDFARALGGADYRYVAVGGMLAVSTLVLRAGRWRYLFGRTRPTFGDATVATVIGYFTLYVLPLRVGEFVRPWVVGRRSGVPFLRALATVATERVIDAAAILLLLFASLPFLPAGTPVGEILAWEVGGVNIAAAFTMLSVGFVAVLVGVVVFEGVAVRATAVLLPWPAARDAVAGAIGQFAGGVRACTERRAGLAAAVVGTFVVWAAGAMSFLLALHGFSDAAGPVGPRVGLAGAFLLQSIVALAVAAPGPPGFVGTFQFGCVFALGLLGVDRAAAAAFSVAFHVAHYVPTVAIGAATLIGSGVRLRAAISGAPEA